LSHDFIDFLKSCTSEALDSVMSWDEWFSGVDRVVDSRPLLVH